MQKRAVIMRYSLFEKRINCGEERENCIRKRYKDVLCEKTCEKGEMYLRP